MLEPYEQLFHYDRSEAARKRAILMIKNQGRKGRACRTARSRRLKNRQGQPGRNQGHSSAISKSTTVDVDGSHLRPWPQKKHLSEIAIC
jgi:hypothetical protein